MKTLPAGLQDHLDTGATTLAWCWRVTRADATVMGFTDHDRDLAFDGTTFAAATGFTASEVASTLGLSVDNLDVEGALSSEAITEADIAAGLYDGATVEVWRVNWADTSQRVLMRKGAIGEIARSGIAFTAELRGLAHALDQTRGRTYQRTCDADLGDSRCKIDLDDEAFKGSGTVTAASDDRIVQASGLDGFASGWFSHGLVTWTGGANAGRSMEVRAHTLSGETAFLTLWHAMPDAIAADDTFTGTAGCDRTFDPCTAKFDHAVNYRGFPHMPGNDRAFGYVVGESGDNDGGSFFN